MKDFFVVDAAKFDGAAVTTFFAVSSMSVREKKTGAGQYLALTLSDKTGTIEARMWDDIASAVATCSEGCYVKVQGQVSKYQGKWQITLTKMRLAAESEVDAADFVPTTQFDIGEMWAELRGYVGSSRMRSCGGWCSRFWTMRRSARRTARPRRPRCCTMRGSAGCWSMW